MGRAGFAGIPLSITLKLQNSSPLGRRGRDTPPLGDGVRKLVNIGTLFWSEFQIPNIILFFLFSGV